MLITRIVEDRDALFLAVENLGSLSLAFGEDVAAIVADQVRHCAHSFLRGEIELQPLSPSIFTLNCTRDDAKTDLLALDELCALISATPFHVRGVDVMAVVSLHEDIAGAQSACAQHTALMSDDWFTRYRSDMALASRFVKRAADGSLVTLWRPIRSTRMPDVVLHYEAVPKLLEADGRTRDCAAEHDALERLGMSWIYDRANLLGAIEELSSDARPCIAVQLAPQSLKQSPNGCCGRWLAALRRLEAAPDVAARLIIEISGAFAGTSIESIREHLAGFRQLGVSLSVANFASSDINFGALITLDPDVVKISATFMRGAVIDPSNGRRLQLLFKLAGTMSRTVVVDGIDGERHMQIARALGAEWVKGQSVGEPSIGRHWKIVQTAQRHDTIAANSDEIADVWRQASVS